MDRQQQLLFIKQKCIHTKFPGAWEQLDDAGRRAASESIIRLADALLALNSTTSLRVIGINDAGQWLEWNSDTNNFHELDSSIRWNLRQDDLTEQTDDCIQFLVDLLK